MRAMKKEKLTVQRIGQKIGEQTGKQKRTMEIAKALKELGNPIEKIAKVTGLSKEEMGL